VSEYEHPTDGFFGERVASTYDNDPEMFSPDVVGPTVEFLAALADGRRALELGIGTGRIALPLAERGVEVTGIDLSRAMVERLRAKPGGTELEVALGDFSTTRVEGEFGLVYLVFNTIFNLVTQEAQIACFENAARHLVPGGTFVIETMVPDLQRLALGNTVLPFRAEPSGISFDVYDVVTQRFSSQHYTFRPDGVDAYPVDFRYAWPAELDLMARLAGLELGDRYGGWRREPFTATSSSHVSVYVKP